MTLRTELNEDDEDDDEQSWQDGVQLLWSENTPILLLRIIHNATITNPIYLRAFIKHPIYSQFSAVWGKTGLDIYPNIKFLAGPVHLTWS